MRIIAAMLLLAAIAIGTGSVLLLGYVLAAFSLGAILFILARRTIRRLGDARLGKPRLFRRSTDGISRTHYDHQRPAA